MRNVSGWGCNRCSARLHFYIYVRRFDLALRAPDALHLAIARRLDATLVTLDRRRAAAAGELGIAVDELKRAEPRAQTVSPLMQCDRTYDIYADIDILG